MCVTSGVLQVKLAGISRLHTLQLHVEDVSCNASDFISQPWNKVTLDFSPWLKPGYEANQDFIIQTLGWQNAGSRIQML